ncbi:MAG: 6-pyruvoyl tetrahydropterin synthase family protein [Gemmatimonadota bacterium]
MPQARMIRRFHFRARHHYGRSGEDPTAARARLGDLARPHEHTWEVEVHVQGPVDEATGWVTDVAALDAAFEEITAGWEGGDLNVLIPEVASGALQPSTEVVARWLFKELKGRIEPPAQLVEVRVFEDPDLGAVYPG